MLAFGSVLYGQTSNAIPYQETFEGITAGESILVPDNTNGWYGNTNTVSAFVTNVSYVWTNVLHPVESAAHTKVLKFTDVSLTNRFTAPEVNTTVDFMAQPVRNTAALSNSLVTGSQTALYLDTNGLLTVWYGIDNTGTNNAWLTYTSTPVGTADWARVTIALDYTTDASNSFFKVTLDGVDLQPPTNGYIKGVGAFNADPNGTWLLIANQVSKQIQSFAVVGSGMLDDLVVTTNTVTEFFPISNYLLTVNSGKGGGSYTNGALVEIAANAPAAGQIFDQWTGDTQYVASVSSASTTVTMPAQAVSVTATYKDIAYTLTGSAGANGTASPSTTNVVYNGSVHFTITANSYYRIASLTTNGAPVAGMSFDNSSTAAGFTWSNVLADGALAATFTAQLATDPAGTPYSWLAGFGLTNYNVDALADQDGDGLKTWQEYIANTDPTNSASCLKAMQSIRNVVSWVAQTNRIYSVYWSTNLVQGFTALNTNIVPPQNSWTNLTPDAKVNHYQVRVRMQ
jgi:hypothetical protein